MLNNTIDKPIFYVLLAVMMTVVACYAQGENTYITAERSINGVSIDKLSQTEKAKAIFTKQGKNSFLIKFINEGNIFKAIEVKDEQKDSAITLLNGKQIVLSYERKEEYGISKNNKMAVLGKLEVFSCMNDEQYSEYRKYFSNYPYYGQPTYSVTLYDVTGHIQWVKEYNTFAHLSIVSDFDKYIFISEEDPNNEEGIPNMAISILDTNGICRYRYPETGFTDILDYITSNNHQYIAFRLGSAQKTIFLNLSNIQTFELNQKLPITSISNNGDVHIRNNDNGKLDTLHLQPLLGE